MPIGPLNYEFYLLRFADIYFLIGMLEIKLRLEIPVTLSTHAKNLGYSGWLDVIPQTKGNLFAIRKGFEMNRSQIYGIEDQLPFSFWSHLFRREYYSVLWTPALYKIFPGVRNPRNIGSFLIVVQNMRRATRIRNRVAHFNLVNAGDYEDELATLNWLLSAMSGPSVN